MKNPRRITKPSSLVILTCLLNTTLSSAATSPQPLVNLAPDDVAGLVELLKACDSALTACDKANTDKVKELEKENELLNVTNTALDAERSRNNGLFHQPAFWFAIGVLATGGMTYLIK